MKFFQSIYKNIFTQSKFLVIITAVSILLNIANWIFLYIYIQPTEYPITLHYNIYFGPDLIGAWWRIFFLPISGTAIIGVNIIVAYLIKSSKAHIYQMHIASFLSQLILCFASLLIAMQN